MPSAHYYPDYNSDGLLADHHLSDAVLPGAHWQNIYDQSETQNFPIGTRLQLHDRTFFYACAGGTTAVAMKAGHNNSAELSVNTAAVIYAAGTKDVVILDTSDRVAHYYQNGYLWVMNLTSGIYQFLKVKDSDVATDVDSVTIHLYDPLPFAIPASTFITIHRNPFASITFTTDTKKTMVGVPLIPVTATRFFWIQTWGPCFGTAMSAIPGAAAADREVFFNSDGALINGASLTTNGVQRAGFILPNTTGGGDQFYMLQIAP